LGKLESTIKSEIQRLAKREVRASFLPLRREVRALRLRLSSLSKNFSVLDRLAKEQLHTTAVTIHLLAKRTPGFAMVSYCLKSYIPTHPEDQWVNLYLRLHS